MFTLLISVNLVLFVWYIRFVLLHGLVQHYLFDFIRILTWVKPGKQTNSTAWTNARKCSTRSSHVLPTTSRLQQALHRLLLRLHRHTILAHSHRPRLHLVQSRYHSAPSAHIAKTSVPADSDGSVCGVDLPQYPFIYLANPPEIVILASCRVAEYAWLGVPLLPIRNSTAKRPRVWDANSTP